MAVVKTSCLDVLYKDLPVVIVNEWSDVNMDLLTAASAISQTPNTIIAV
jgi:hypothetical protein